MFSDENQIHHRKTINEKQFEVDELSENIQHELPPNDSNITISKDELSKKRSNSLGALHHRILRAIWSTRNTVKAEDQRTIIRTSLRELLIYLMFLILLLLISLLSINKMTYFYYTSVFNQFIASPGGDNSQPLSFIIDKESMWKYLQGQLIDSLFSGDWYNQLNVPFNQKEFIGFDNKVLGLVRLRQLRVDSKYCYTPKDMTKLVKDCYPAYSYSTRQTTPIIPQSSMIPNLTKNAWSYRSSSETGATTFSAPYGTYDGSGYVQDLSRSSEESKIILKELFDGKWIDQATRVLLVDFTIYNANINMFIIVKIVFEMPLTGGMFPSNELQPAKLLRYQTSLDYFVMACEIMYLIFILYYTVEEIIEIYYERCKYFLSIWNLMDLAMIFISVICASFTIYSTISVNKHMHTLINDISTYPNFDYLGYWYAHYIRAIALCVFLAVIKIFKYLTFDYSLNQLTRTLSVAAYDLLGFFIMFCIVYFAFAQLGYLAFSASTLAYSSFTQSTYSLFRIMVGDVDFPSLLQAHKIFGPLFFITFVFFVFFILLNMFLAIIDDAYSNVKEELVKQKNALTLGHLLKKKAKDMVKKMRGKRTKPIVRILREFDLMGRELIPYEYYRKALKSNGYSDAEINSIFLKYDEDGDNCLNKKEQERMAYEMEMGLVNKGINPNEDEGIGTDDESPDKETSSIHKNDNIIEYVDPRDYLELVENVDLLETTLVSIITRADELLESLEEIEMAKREHRFQLSNIIQEMTIQIKAEKAKVDGQGNIE